MSVATTTQLVCPACQGALVLEEFGVYGDRTPISSEGVVQWDSRSELFCEKEREVVRCPHCQRELPELAELLDRTSGRAAAPPRRAGAASEVIVSWKMRLAEMLETAPQPPPAGEIDAAWLAAYQAWREQAQSLAALLNTPSTS